MNAREFMRDAEENWSADECAAAVEHYLYLKGEEGDAYARQWMRDQVAHLLKADCDIAQHFAANLRAELGMPHGDAAIKLLTLFGSQFEEISTGGSCRALCCRAPDGAHILITAYDEAELPSARNWSLICYDADAQMIGARGLSHCGPFSLIAQ